MKKERDPKRLSKKMLKTLFIVLRSTSSVQDCVEHIQEGINQVKVKTEEKLIYIPFKMVVIMVQY